MARVIAIMNQQQGVGKSTITLNLGDALSQLDQTVMLIDMVPSAELTRQFFEPVDQGIAQCLLEKKSLDESSHTVADNITLVPANKTLAQFQKKRGIALQQGHRLERLITAAEQQIILIDSPSKPGLLMLNSLFAADEIIIPVRANYVSLQGLVKIVALFKRLKRITQGAKLWIVINGYDATVGSQVDIFRAIQTTFPGRVLRTALHYHPQLNNGLQSVFTSSITPLTGHYLSLAKDVLNGTVY